MIVFVAADKETKSVTVYLSHCLALEYAYPIMTLSGRGLEYFIQQLVAACKVISEPGDTENFIQTIRAIDDIGINKGRLP